jgi:hypothetical protein
MLGKLSSIVLIVLIAFLLGAQSPAQTTNGLMTGTITDAAGAVVAGAQVNVTNQGTSELRTTTTDSNGYYIVPQLPPGIYDISIKKQGFATVDRPNVQLQVNQNATLDFKLPVSSTAQTIKVTGAPPALNTTSATLGDVIGHSATVDLPLNGREFTQLTLLTPGAAPVEGPQQAAFTVALGAGGISPSVNGQRGQQNNFTMDGVLNNAIFTDIWAISPPPDALQEFNVQSHITDAQFAITSGANINIVTRSGTNTFHGSAWEFARNAVLDAQQFPEVRRTPYSQNQYGLYLGGPIIKDNSWFSVYWEGFRSAQTLSYFGSTFTAAMTKGDFSALLGPQVGTDSLGRPEFKNEIYDPATSRPDPNHPGESLRDPFPGNIIPPNRINPDAPIILQKYYPAPNLNVAANVLPNIQFSGANATASDVTGIRLDHRFRNNDTLFGRYNRSNANLSSPEQLPSPGFSHVTNNYAQEYAVGYTHLFGTTTILNLHYGYTNTNEYSNDPAAGSAFDSALNVSLAMPAHNGISLGPEIILSNGYSGVSQFAIPLGPQENSDYHVDLSKVVGNHTFGVGGMFYRIHSFDDGWGANVFFTQNATSQDALTGATGLGPASFMLGLPDSYAPWVGNTAADETTNWYGGYVQDLWQASKKLSITVGLRYDYVAPVNFHKIVSGMDVLTGQFIVTGSVLPLYPTATGPSRYFYPQYNGYEPRFGVNYQALNRTVLQGAFAMLDDHNNTLVQESQGIRVSWPVAIAADLPSLDLGLPTTYINHLPDASIFFNPNKPFAGYSADPHNKIPYSIEYNAGIEQQLSNTLVLNLDYVGSVSRHQALGPNANDALVPGPGPISQRQPFPQFGPFQFATNAGSANYNALQAELKKSLSSGLFFQASYTWSKSMDIESSLQSGTIENFYNMQADYGPSDFNRSQMLVLSGVYALPVGRGKRYLSSPNGFVQAIAGNWNVGSIISLVSGAPFDVLAGGDVANVGGGTQRAEQIGNPYSAPGFHQSQNEWINTAAFAIPKQYTFGNESRNNLVGPPYKDVDFNAYKDFLLTSRATLQLRGEFFNLFNHTNYGLPVNNVQSPAFGKIFGANPAREIQFAAKVLF